MKDHLVLRKPQIKALDAIESAYIKGHHRLLFTMPTGTGKTTVFTLIKKRLKIDSTVLVLAHTDTLVNQAYDRWHSIFPKDVIGIEQGARKTDKDVKYSAIFATRQTLTKGRLKQFILDHKIDIIVIDEAHLVQTSQYLELLNAFNCLPLSNTEHPLLIGCSATPWRLDKKSLQDIFPHHVYDYPIIDAMRDKLWCEINAWRLKTETDLTNVGNDGSDFAQKALEDAVNIEYRTNLIVDKWKELGGMKDRTLVFAAGKEHARALTEAFQKEAVNVYCLFGETPDRHETFKKFLEMPKPTVLVNIEVATVGVDLPGCTFIVNARPTKSSGLFIQMIGRGTRIYLGNPKIGDLPKESLKLLDIVDSLKNHRSVMTTSCILGLPSNFDLEGKNLLEAKELIDKLFEEDPYLAAAAANIRSKGDDLPTNLAELKAELERIAVLAPENPRGATAGISKLEWMVDDKDAIIEGDLMNANAYSLFIPRPINPKPQDNEVLLRLDRDISDGEWVLTKYTYPEEKFGLTKTIDRLIDELKKKEWVDESTGEVIAMDDRQKGAHHGRLKHLRNKVASIEMIEVSKREMGNSLETALKEIEPAVFKKYPNSTMLIDETSRWRREPPSEGQLKIAQRLHINVKPHMRMGDLSRLIDRAMKLKEEERKIAR